VSDFDPSVTHPRSHCWVSVDLALCQNCGQCFVSILENNIGTILGCLDLTASELLLVLALKIVPPL